MEKERGITITHKDGNNVNTVLAIVGNKKYNISDEKIKDGDLIYNKPTNEIDKCIAIFPDGMMCVEFASKARAIIGEWHYKKAIPQ